MYKVAAKHDSAPSFPTHIQSLRHPFYGPPRVIGLVFVVRSLQSRQREKRQRVWHCLRRTTTVFNRKRYPQCVGRNIVVTRANSLFQAGCTARVCHFPHAPLVGPGRPIALFWNMPIFHRRQFVLRVGTVHVVLQSVLVVGESLRVGCVVATDLKLIESIR
jgi:hypothetical protein